MLGLTRRKLHGQHGHESELPVELDSRSGRQSNFNVQRIATGGDAGSPRDASEWIGCLQFKFAGPDNSGSGADDSTDSKSGNRGRSPAFANSSAGGIGEHKQYSIRFEFNRLIGFIFGNRPVYFDRG